ncbi:MULTISPECIES: hypothetical protein [Chromobacterium]|uniref:hypothetical protein n=1 Tax=Chromobacterium TaxID=535 RepID=UPI0005BE72D3|nr:MULTISPECIES: hypothetical protein [Chromobacterium]QOZ81786.1 hypothetical protein DXT74_01130 [Chromobacterium sp. Rain0013]WON81777.1 hypothetical protein OK026_11395 [Chromobacterium haemolyticum]
MPNLIEHCKSLLLQTALGVALSCAVVPALANLNDPVATLKAKAPPPIVATCLDERMRKLRIPSEYIERERGKDHGETVRLTNPATNKDGLEILIRQDGDASKLTVNTHGLSYSKAWRKLVNDCAQRG